MIGKNILLVEDDIKSQYALKSVLQDLGHTVVAFFNTEEAEKSSERFDLAIIDIRPPDAHGSEFAMIFKERNPRSRIIFVTTYDSIPHIRDAVPSCVVLVKPIDMDLLIKLL